MTAGTARGWGLRAAALAGVLALAASFASGQEGQKQQDTQQQAPAEKAWHTVTGPERSFTVDIPAAPKYTPTQLGTPAGIAYTMHQYDLEQEAASYVVQYLVYPKDINITNPQQNFQHGLNAAAKRMDGGKWTSTDFIKHQGQPAADAIGAREGAEIRSYSVLKGRQLFTLIYVGAPGTAKGVDAERFITSLKVAP